MTPGQAAFSPFVWHLRGIALMSITIASVGCGQATRTAESPQASATEGAAAGEYRSEEEAAFEEEAPAEVAAEVESDVAEGAEGAENKAEKMSATQLQGHLAESLSGFEDSMNPKELSCKGAVPYKDAICSIAARLCSDEDPTSLNKKDCTDAQKSCKEANKRLKKSCP